MLVEKVVRGTVALDKVDTRRGHGPSGSCCWSAVVLGHRGYQEGTWTWYGLDAGGQLNEIVSMSRVWYNRLMAGGKWLGTKRFVYMLVGACGWLVWMSMVVPTHGVCVR
nr:hypothetical protein Iba_chr12fCG9710 [Ipomoea batatas]